MDLQLVASKLLKKISKHILTISKKFKKEHLCSSERIKGDFTFSSKSGFRNLRGKTLTCSERRRSILRASMARPRYSLTSSSGSFTSMLSPKPNLQNKKLLLSLN